MEALIVPIEEEKQIEEEDEPDKFGARRALRQEIKTKYEFIKVIGKGSYGLVSKAKCKNTGRIVAIKIF